MVPKTESVLERIGREVKGQLEPLRVQTVLKRWPSASQPVLVQCDDNQLYVIKGSQNQKSVFNEYVCGRLGNLINAAVAWLRFVMIPTELSADPDLNHFGKGLALGSLYMADASERQAIAYVNEPTNRTRFAGLAILYSWCMANDQQLLYRLQPPHEVLSNDHGHFFPNGPNWDISALQAAMQVTRDPWFDGCKLNAVDFAPYWPLLEQVTPEQIQQITSAPPLDWGVDIAERNALASYLETRRMLVRGVF